MRPGWKSNYGEENPLGTQSSGMAPRAQMPSQHREPSEFQRLFTGCQGPPGQRIAMPPWPSWRNSIRRLPSSSPQCSPSRSTRMVQFCQAPAASLHCNGTSNGAAMGAGPGSNMLAWEREALPGGALAGAGAGPLPAITPMTPIPPVTASTVVMVSTPVIANTPITAIGPVTAVTPANSN